MSISTKYHNTVGPQRGMVVSNEPGYYEVGQLRKLGLGLGLG